MRKLLFVLLLFFPIGAFAQTQTVRLPDCNIPFYFSTSAINGTISLASPPAVTSSYNNSYTACTSWALTYQVTGLSGVSIEFDGAPDNNGAPGSFSTWPTVTSGSLPATSTTYAQIVGSGFAPWLEVKVNSITGSGQITGALVGYRTGTSGFISATIIGQPIGVSCTLINCPPNTQATFNNAETVASPTDLPLTVTSVPAGTTGVTSFVAATSGGLTVAATANDIAVIPGNATTTVYVTQVQVSCTQTTAGTNDIFLIKRSTADAGGTNTAMTVGAMDSTNAANNSTPLAYTANPATGTLAARVDVAKLTFLAPATAAAIQPYIWSPPLGQAVVLRGTTQQLAVNLNGQTTTGAICDVRFSWIEK